MTWPNNETLPDGVNLYENMQRELTRALHAYLQDVLRLSIFSETSSVLKITPSKDGMLLGFAARLMVDAVYAHALQYIDDAFGQDIAIGDNKILFAIIDEAISISIIDKMREWTEQLSVFDLGAHTADEVHLALTGYYLEAYENYQSNRGSVQEISHLLVESDEAVLQAVHSYIDVHILNGRG